MSVTHRWQDLASFQSGEIRLVYARHKAQPGEVFFLEDGEALELREWTKSELECLMPECADRRLTTVSRARSGRRDGFMHMRGAGGHAPESLFHRQAKLRIVEWVLRRYPSLEVRAEEIAADGERIADVMISSHIPHGRLAVEIQYSKLAYQSWLDRHESYRNAGVNDVWLFGHASQHLRMAEDGERAQLGNLQRRMLAAGMPVFWINPVEGTVATARIDGSHHFCSCGHRHGTPGEFWLQPSEHDFAIGVGIDRLDDCRLRRGEFVTPTLLQIEAHTSGWQQRRDEDHREADRVAEERRRAWAKKQRAWQLANAESERKEQARRQAVVLQAQKELTELRRWWLEHRPKLDQAWATSDLRQELDQYAESVRKVLAAELDSDLAARATPEHWHMVLYREHVWGRPVGHRFTFKQCVHTLRQAGITLHPNPSRVANAVQQFASALERAGCVAKQGRALVVQFHLKTNQHPPVRRELALAKPAPDTPSPPGPPIALRNGADEYSRRRESASVRCARCGRTSFDSIVLAAGVHADPYCDR